MKGTAIYPSPVGDIQLDWEDGAVTALKNADRAAKTRRAERADSTGISAVGRIFCRDAQSV